MRTLANPTAAALKRILYEKLKRRSQEADYSSRPCHSYQKLPKGCWFPTAQEKSHGLRHLLSYLHHDSHLSGPLGWKFRWDLLKPTAQGPWWCWGSGSHVKAGAGSWDLSPRWKWAKVMRHYLAYWEKPAHNPSLVVWAWGSCFLMGCSERDTATLLSQMPQMHSLNFIPRKLQRNLNGRPFCQITSLYSSFYNMPS